MEQPSKIARQITNCGMHHQFRFSADDLAWFEQFPLLSPPIFKHLALIHGNRAMKIDVSYPADDKAEDKTANTKKPASLWGHIVQMTPIVLTVLATALAGMSNSEMTQSMYRRTLAGQFEAKASGQWAYFQAKRIRGTNLEGTVALLRSVEHVQSFDGGQFDTSLAGAIRLLTKLSAGSADSAAAIQTKFDRWLAAARTSQTLTYLEGPAMPKSVDQQLPDTADFHHLTVALQAMSQRPSDAEFADVVKPVRPSCIEQASLLAQQNSDAFDKSCAPVSQAAVQLRAIVAELSAAAKPLLRPEEAENPTDERSKTIAALQAKLAQLGASVETAIMDFDARRYRRESTYNQNVAEMLELRVARSGFESDINRRRSRNFFYSMLIAQAGVTIASLALARAHHSLFWSIAAFAAISSLCFTCFTYFGLA